MKVLLLFACISTCGALRCYECSTHDLACQINPKKAATITNRCAFCSTATTMNLGGGKTGVEEETLLREKDASKSALFSGRDRIIRACKGTADIDKYRMNACEVRTSDGIKTQFCTCQTDLCNKY